MFTPQDYEFMARALRLAERGLFTTTPNPRVGCVVVHEGRVVGEGWHEKVGEPHAEVHALQAAGERARRATAYVTLEPCSHYGRTPPCVSALVRAGITRVVGALQDPNPLVSGSGFAALRAAGIEVASPILESEAWELNAGFVSRMTRGRPWLRLKIAASLDGRTALLNGAAKWITSSEARRDAHRWRARACGVLSGIGTVLADDPQLSVRDIDTPRQPLKVIVDNRLEIPLSARVLEGGGVLIATLTENHEKIAQLQALGAEVLCLPQHSGKIDLNALMRVLAQRGFNEITAEAGARLNGALLEAGLVDEIVLYAAPVLIGDQARGLFGLREMQQMTERVGMRFTDVRMVGPDLRIIARPESAGSAPQVD